MLTRGCRNPVIECPVCGRSLTTNVIKLHLRSHDPVIQEERRCRRNARQSAYAKTPAGRLTTARRNRSPVGAAGARRRTNAWKQTPVGKLARQSHGAVAQAVKRGALTREPCRVCGDPKTFAHHPRGYEREHWLDVDWLCLTHHMEAHGRVAA